MRTILSPRWTKQRRRRTEHREKRTSSVSSEQKNHSWEQNLYNSNKHLYNANSKRTKVPQMFVSAHVLPNVFKGTLRRIEKSEFDIIKFWLFLYLHHKELQDLLCNVIEHRSPETRKNQGNCFNDNEQVFPSPLLSLHTLLTIIF